MRGRDVCALVFFGLHLSLPAAGEEPARLRNVLFRYQSSAAEEVALIGDFNNWRPEPMLRGPKGGWILSKRLPDGSRYRYNFLVNRRVVTDPWNRNTLKRDNWVFSVLELRSPGKAWRPQRSPPPEPPILEIGKPEETPHEKNGAPNRISLRTSFSEESTPFWRYTAILRGEAYPQHDLRIRVETMRTRMRDQTDEIERNSGGLSMRKALGANLFVEGLYRMHIIENDKGMDEWSGLVGGNLFHGPVETHAGYRYHPFVDTPVTFEDVAYLEGTGSGGSTLEMVRRHTGIRETVAGMSWTPADCLTAYGEGTAGRIDGGNEENTLTAGASLDVLGALASPQAQAFRLTVDYSWIGFREETEDYYSPRRQDSLTPGIAWRLSLSNGFVLGLEVGRTLSHASTPGYTGTAILRIPLTKTFMLEARGQHGHSLVYQVTNVLIGLNAAF